MSYKEVLCYPEIHLAEQQSPAKAVHPGSASAAIRFARGYTKYHDVTSFGTRD